MGSSRPRPIPPSARAAPVLLALILSSCSGAGGVVGPGGEEPPPASLYELLGPALVRADGSPADVNAVAARALVGLYFAASTCPACGSFTPSLVKAYQEIQLQGKSFEVVLVSLDNSSAEMFDHMLSRGMPWPAIPHSRLKAESLAQRYGIAWIPELVILDRRGALVSAAGRDGVALKGAAAYDDWLAAAGT